MGLNMGPATEPAVARDVAQLAEELGYDSLWVGDHPILPRPPLPGSPFSAEYPFGAPLVALAYVAAATTRILLGTGVLLVPQRNPVHLAKEIATLDRLCGGRLIMGVGVGYMEAEFRAIGARMADRGALADEYLAAMRELWVADAPSFEGSHFSIHDIEFLPRPVQVGGPPIVVGGHSAAAFDRAARIGDGWLGWFLEPDQVARRVPRIHDRPRPAGKGPLEISVMPSGRLTPETAHAYDKAGVDRIVVTPAPGMDTDTLLKFVARNAPAEMGLSREVRRVGRGVQDR